MENCCLCGLVFVDEAHIEAHLDEQHSDIFKLSKPESPTPIKQEACTSQLEQNITPKTELTIKEEEEGPIETESSLLEPESNPSDIKSDVSEPTSSLLDLKCSECDFKSSNIHETRDHQIEKHYATYLKSITNQSKAKPAKAKPAKAKPVKVKRLKAKKKVKKVKPKSDLDNLGTQQIVCTLCDKEFKTRKRLSYHKYKVHTSKGNYSCSNCADSSFPSKSRLNLHNIKVHQAKKWQCVECPKAFHLKSNLALHIKSLHSLQNKMTCRICQKHLSWRAFNDKNSEVVNGIKEHKCNNCVKRETNPDAPNPERVVCTVCNKDYKNEGVLKIHHHDVHVMNNVFPCFVCGKSLASRSSFNIHMKHVHGDKTFFCHPCNKFFGQKRHFIKHNISIHSDNNKRWCYKCQKSLSFNVFSKKNTVTIDGQSFPICYYCSKKENH